MYRVLPTDSASKLIAVRICSSYFDASGVVFSGFGFALSDSRLQISDLGFHISGIAFQVSGTRYCIPPSRSQVSGLKYVGCLGSDLWVSCVQFHTFRISWKGYCIRKFRFHVSGYRLLYSYSQLQISIFAFRDSLLRSTLLRLQLRIMRFS